MHQHQQACLEGWCIAIDTTKKNDLALFFFEVHGSSVGWMWMWAWVWLKTQESQVDLVQTSVHPGPSHNAKDVRMSGCV